MADPEEDFSPHDRKRFFLKLAERPGGVSVPEAYREALAAGDRVTEEAYYNLARRLRHLGHLVIADPHVGGGDARRYRPGADPGDQWLEEDDLSALIDPDYPLIALTIWRESWRQINELPEGIWAELRERLRSESARTLFFDAIVSYCDDLHAQLQDLVDLEARPPRDMARRRQDAENSRQLLVNLAKHGLGLSKEAVRVPLSIETAISEMRAQSRDGGAASYVDETLLAEELRSRVADEPFVVEIADATKNHERHGVIGAVDGSSRGGMLAFLGEGGDFSVGHAPMISINTAVGQVTTSITVRGRKVPAAIRLPERPEDMQRQDNRYTVMAKLLYPDLSDAKYLHSIWNAMDVLEAKAAFRLLSRWPAQTGQEIAPADVVLRDGAVSPQDRDFNHYAESSSYGRIVRDMIQTHWEIAAKCRDGAQTMTGIVKTTQLHVLSPVLNWYASRLAARRVGQIEAWPMRTLNFAPDQLLVTKLLTAGRKKGEPWTRTCIVMRPFHALTNYADVFSRARSATQMILDLHERWKESPDATSQDKRLFFETFRPDSDPFLKMLDHVQYASVFITAVPRLDLQQTLPRVEFVVPEGFAVPTALDNADAQVARIVRALRQSGGFTVSSEHDMFTNPPKIDVLPRLAVDVHDAVKAWASVLLSRVQEYIGHHLARYVRTKKVQGVRVRPWKRRELEMLLEQLKSEREIQAGADPPKFVLPSGEPAND